MYKFGTPLINDFHTRDYRTTRTFEERIEESSRMRAKYPDRIPVICQKTPQSTLSALYKSKYLVPKELTSAQFLYVIRKRLQLTSEKALFIFIEGVMPSSNFTFDELYETYKNTDGFLYISYAEENVFG
jgi:GABA(A) receptor-associated protein